MKGSVEATEDLTTDKFYGWVSLLEGDVEKSWVARYLDGTFPTGKTRLPGAYSMRVYEKAEETYEEETIEEEHITPSARHPEDDDESDDEDYDEKEDEGSE